MNNLIDLVEQKYLIKDERFDDTTVFKYDFKLKIFENCVFENVTFNSCVFNTVTFKKCSFINVVFFKCDFKGCIIEDSIDTDYKIEFSQIDELYVLEDSNSIPTHKKNKMENLLQYLTNRNSYYFEEKKFKGSNIHSFVFGSKTFVDCVFEEIKFFNCEFTNIYFHTCEFINVEFVDCVFKECHFENRGIKFIDCFFDDETQVHIEIPKTCELSIKKNSKNTSEIPINKENNSKIEPDYYKINGIECIDIAKHFNFNLGNVIKYIWRAGKKDNIIQDLEKAKKYLDFEIKRLTESESSDRL